MKFDKETIIGLILCMVVMFAWPSISEYLGWSAPAETPVEESVQTPAPATPAPAAQLPAKAPESVAAPVTAPAPAKVAVPSDGMLSNGMLTLTVSGENGGISKIRFPKYKSNDLKEEITLDSSLFTFVIPNAKTLSIAPVVNRDGAVTSSRVLEISGAKVKVEQTYTLSDNYVISCRYTLANLSSAPVTLSNAVITGGSIAPWHMISGDKMRTMSHRMDFMSANGDIEDIDADEDDEDFYKYQNHQVQWASVSNKYFCSVLKCNAGNYMLHLVNPRKQLADSKGKNYNIITIGAALPVMTLQPGTVTTLDFAGYTGPKSSAALEAFVPSGEKVMHLAWGPLNYLARFLMWILNLLYSICGSYGVSIIILTLLVRSAFYPLTSKGNESMRKMQKVQPMFKELKEKYQNDPQLLNQKMTELYRKEGINPLAGCFPILLQIPIFFALYAMLDNAVALRHVSFLWCKNLAAADTIFSIPLGFTLPILGIDAIPVNPLVLIMTVLMVIQQKMTPMAADPAQKKMMAMMPVIMLLFLYDLPSGLTLYWTISNLFSIIQLWLQKRRGQALQTAQGK
ncbi:MAG: membrane protein insertase YidC [Lentisphaeria bacterium]|nr:membrane protein insertase YidC [Lentisphaeria bacterium]